jgi:hypothetical protein
MLVPGIYMLFEIWIQVILILIYQPLIDDVESIFV